MDKNLKMLKKDWKVENGRLKISLTLDNFLSCVEMIEEIAKIAEKMDHHPDLCIRSYKNLSIEIYTHEEDAITQKDYRLAEKIEQLL
jgi:4a-hydroxytetrahydrobiopterin dehydratase